MATIRIDIPPEVERLLAGEGGDAARAAKEAVLVDLYRRELIGHARLAELLGVSRYEADGVLKRHGVMLEITIEEIEAEAEAIRKDLRERS